MCIEKYAEVYNVEYAVVWWKVCRDVQCVHCRVYRHDAIPDGITLHLGMEILSLATRTAWTSEARHTRSSILTRYFGIPTGGPDTVVFWYFGHVFWYFGADTKMAFFCGTDPTSVAPPALDCMISEVAFGRSQEIDSLFIQIAAWENLSGFDANGEGERTRSCIVEVQEIQVGGWGGVGAAKLHSFPFKWCSDLYF